MTQSMNLPHVYYTVGELSLVKDVKTLKNANVKTMAFIRDDFAYDLDYKGDSLEKSNRFVKLDLSYIYDSIEEIKPCLIFGVLYTLNRSAHIFVKTVKQINLEMYCLIAYHQQSLILRKRSPHFEPIGNVESESKTSVKID